MVVHKRFPSRLGCCHSTSKTARKERELSCPGLGRFARAGRGARNPLSIASLSRAPRAPPPWAVSSSARRACPERGGRLSHNSTLWKPSPREGNRGEHASDFT